MKHLLLSNIVGLCILLGGISAKAEEKPAAAEEEKKAARSLPFRGKIDAVDTTAQSIKVGARTFHAIASTKIIKAGKPATLAEATVGEEVGGSYRDAEGKLELVSLRLGAKPGAPAKEKKE